MSIAESIWGEALGMDRSSDGARTDEVRGSPIIRRFDSRRNCLGP
jgi:hypothetical protein